MPRRYQHISNYENEILEMRKKGVTTREIADRFGLSREQIKGFIKRRNRKIRMIEAGQVIHKKGRPGKSDNGIPPSIQRLDKLTQMRYVMASKDRYIKRLEMENKISLLLNFYSATSSRVFLYCLHNLGQFILFGGYFYIYYI